MEIKDCPQLKQVDFRLAHCKQELETILAKQDELLAQVHPELRQDFCMTRAERMRQLTETERENFWILQTWTF